VIQLQAAEINFCGMDIIVISCHYK